MCLAVPGKVVCVQAGENAVVDTLGVRRDVSLRLVPAAREGDYVLVHAGFAIQVIEPDQAEETLQLLRDLSGFLGEHEPEAPAPTGFGA